MPLKLFHGLSPRTFVQDHVTRKSKQQQQAQAGEEPLLLHFDVNKTVIHSDSIQKKNIEEGIREGIAELFWGTVRKDADKGRIWEWCKIYSYSCQPPPHQTGSDKMVNYAQFCKETIKDKQQRKLAVRTFELAGAAQEDMERLHYTTLKKMELPESVRGQKEAIESGLKGLTMNMFPTLFHLVATLQRQRRQFAVLFRSFGADHDNITTEWNAFCEMKHPVFKSLLEGIGPLDGSKEGVPDRRIHKTHTLYRDEKGPVLILETHTNGPQDQSWDQWAKSNPPSDTRDGRAFILGMNYATVEGYPQIQKWMKRHLTAQMTSAIKDDWAWWQFKGENSESGKLLPVMKGVTQLFFDDNIEHELSRIVDCRDTNGIPIPAEASLNKFCVKVNPVEALLDDDYFLMKLRLCTGETQMDTGSKVAKAQRQISEMEEKQRNLERKMEMMEHQLKTVTLDNQRMRMKNKIDPKDQDDLRQLLEKHGIDLTSQEPDGNQALKTAQDLWEEIEAGYCWLELDASGKLVRVLDMCYLRIIHKDHLLIEQSQQDQNAVLQINYLPGVRIPVNKELTNEMIASKFGKMLGVNFETFMKLDSFPVAEQTAPEQTTIASKLYGKVLPCKVHQHIGVCSVDEAGSNSNLEDARKMNIRNGGRSEIQRERFNSTDPDTGLSHFWRWEKRASWEFRVAAPTNRGVPGKVFEVQENCKRMFEGIEREREYSKLVMQMFEQFEANTIAGGFSGSMVIRVQPWENDGMGNLRRGEACVVKLDDAELIRDEVVKSNKVYQALPERAARVLGEPLYVPRVGSDPPRVFGAMRLELAGACWNVPEFQDGDSNLLCTFKDLLIFQGENQLLPASHGEDQYQCGIHGEVDPVIAETFGPGGIVSSLRCGDRERQSESMQRAVKEVEEKAGEPTKLGTITNTEEERGAWYTLKGKKGKHNPWTASPEQYPPGETMGEIYKKFFYDPMLTSSTPSGLPDVPEMVIKPIKAQLKRVTNLAGEDLLPLIALAHGDLNAANIMIDAQEAVWLIDFATSVDMPLFTDMTKFEMACLFEYACIPITPEVLLKLASREEASWKGLMVHDWLKVNHLTARALLKELVSIQNTLHTLDKRKLDEIIERAVLKSEKPAEKQMLYKRALKARLTVEEKTMFESLEFCRQISDLICQGDFLFDTLDYQATDDEFMRISSTPGAQSLKYFLEKCVGIRKHMHQDILNCLKEEKQKSALRLIDTLSLQVWMNLLRETFRIPGYKDISPMHKAWSIYHCTKVAQRVKEVMDEYERDHKGLTRRMMSKLDRALESAAAVSSQREGLADAHEEVEEDPICSMSESHWFHGNADWIPSTQFVKVVRQVHATDPHYMHEPGLYAPIWVVHQEAQEQPLSAAFNSSAKGSCPIYLEKVWSRGNGPLEVGQFIQKGQKTRVVLKSRILPLTSKLLAPHKNHVHQEGHRVPFKFSMAEWRSGMEENGGAGDLSTLGNVVRRSEGKNSGTHRLSISQPEDVCQFLSLECVIPKATESGRKERVTLVIGFPVFCYPAGTSLAYMPSRPPEPSENPTREVVVLGLGETGGYRFRYATSTNEESEELTPISANHVLLQRCKYKAGDRIMFNKEESGNAKWCDAKILGEATDRNRFLYQVQVEDGAQLKSVHLSVTNSGRVDGASRINASAYEADFRKFIETARTKHSSFIDTMSGLRVSTPTCADANILETAKTAGKHSTRKSTQNFGVGHRASRMHLSKTLSWPVGEAAASAGENNKPIKDLENIVSRYSANQTLCQPLAFLVEGSPGSGKTCLCYKLVHTFTSQQHNLIPLLLPVGELVKRLPKANEKDEQANGQDNGEVTDSFVRSWFDRYLRLQFGGESTRYFMVEQAIRMHRVMFIFEGLEETSGRGPLIPRLIKKLVRERHLVLVTSRPLRDHGMLLDEHDMSDQIRLMTLTDLNESQVKSIAHTRLEDNKEAAESFNRFLFPDDLQWAVGDGARQARQDGQDDQKKVWFNPLMLSMLLCYLLKGKDITGAGTEEQGNTQEITISAVFRVAVDVILMVLQSRMQADRMNRDKSMSVCKRILERMAFAMQLRKGDHHGGLDLDEVEGLLDLESLNRKLEELEALDDKDKDKKSGPALKVPDIWKTLKTSIIGGHAMFLRCSKELSGKEEVLQVRFLVPEFFHYFASSHINNDFARAEKELPELEELLMENWKPVLKMLSQASPHTFVRVITERVKRFKSDDGKTFLHIAAQVGHMPCFKLLSSFHEDHQKCLHKQCGGEMWTPLHVAAHAGDKALCALMLDANANINTEDASGRLPMHVAMQQGFFPTAKFLLDRWMFTMKDGAHRQRPRKNAAEHITKRLLGLDHGPKLTEAEFEKMINEIIELKYFKKSQDNFHKQTVVSMLSIFWVLNDEYERFAESQTEKKMTLASWKRMQEALNMSDLKRNPHRLGALLIAMSIRLLGRIPAFNETFTPTCDTHDEALFEVLSQYPILIPSFAYLEESMQQLILFTAGLTAAFNLGMLWQLESIPANLTVIKEAIDKNRQNAEGLLSFWLMYYFYIFCGIFGGKTKNGSCFMNEDKWIMFQRVNQAIRSFERRETTANEVYDSLLKDIAKTVSIRYDNTDEGVRAQIRLAAQVRAEDHAQAQLVVTSFQALEKRSRLAQFLNSSGIMLKGGPEFLESCKKNKRIELVDGFHVLLNMYKVCQNEYKTTEKDVVTISLGSDIQSYAKTCDDPEVFRFTKLEVKRADGHKADSSGTLNLSAWQWVNDPTDQFQAIQEMVANEVLDSRGQNEPGKRYRSKLMDKITELKNLATDKDVDRVQHEVFMTTLGALMSVFWTARGEHVSFVCCQALADRLSLDSWNEIQDYLAVFVLDADLLHCVVVTLIIKGLGRVPKFRQQLAPHARTPQEALEHVLESCPKTLPSYSSLGEHRKFVRDLLTRDFDFRRFLRAETLPTDLTKVKDILNTRYEFLNPDGRDGRQCLTLYLFCCFAEMSGSLVAQQNSLDGSAYMTERRWKEFLDGKETLEKSEVCSEQEVNDMFLELRAEKLGLLLRRENKESRAAVRLAVMAGCSREAAPKVKACFEELAAEERRLLAGFLAADGIKEKPAFAMHGIGDYLEAALEAAVATDRGASSKSEKFDKAKMLSAMQLLLSVYKRAKAATEQLANRNLAVIDIHLDLLVASVREDRSEITFQDKDFDLKVTDGRDNTESPIGRVYPKVWRRIQRPELLEHYTNLGTALAKELLTQPTRLSEEAFRIRVMRAFPELSYFNAGSVGTGNGERNLAGNGERTLGALLSLFWLVSDQRDLFIRGQPQEEQLTPESWTSIRRWMTETIKLTSEDAVDAMLVFMAIHALGKIPEFRAELAPEFKEAHLHDVALAHVLKTKAEFVPSYARLNEKYKQLIIDSLSVDFQFSQFLKAENVAANLGVVQDKLRSHDEDSFGFFCFRIFAQMCGKSGWTPGPPHTGSLFMTENEYRRFLPGLKTLVKLRTLDPGDAYGSFLLEKGWNAMKFASPEHQALSRLLCLGSASEHLGGFGDEMIDAFKSLSQEKKAKLTEWLIADGINRRPGYVLCDAPNLLENAHSNPSVGLSEALEMLVRVQSKCGPVLELARGRSVPAKVLVHLDEVAAWAKEAAPPLHFSQATVDVKERAAVAASSHAVDTRVIQVMVQRPQPSHHDQGDGPWSTVWRRWCALGCLCSLATLFVMCTCVSLTFMFGSHSQASDLEQRTRPFLGATGRNGEQHRSATADVFGGAAAVFGVLLLICSFLCCCRGCRLPGQSRSVGGSPGAFPLLEGCHLYEAVPSAETDPEAGSSDRPGERSARSSVS